MHALGRESTYNLFECELTRRIVVKDRNKNAQRFLLIKNVGKIKNVKKRVFYFKIKNVKNVFNIYGVYNQSSTSSAVAPNSLCFITASKFALHS